MKTIWKFELTPSKQIEMPKDAKILSVGNQHEQIMIWAEVDISEEEADTEIRYFDIIGTDHDIYTDMGIQRNFIGTVILSGGNYIFHIYERLPL